MIDRREKAAFDGQLRDRSRKNKFLLEFLSGSIALFNGATFLLSTIRINIFIVVTVNIQQWLYFKILVSAPTVTNYI